MLSEFKTLTGTRLNREFTFAKGSIPASHKYPFVPALFNTAEYRELDAATGWCAYYILASKDNEIHGHVHFHLSENRAISPRLAPFGSYEFTSHIPAKVLSEFVDFVEQDLAARGALVILLKNPPPRLCASTLDRHARGSLIGEGLSR